MLASIANWLMEVGSSFDGSDIFAFVGGVIFMIVYKNVRAMMENRHRAAAGKRKINLPKVNKGWFINGFIAIAILLVFWSTLETNAAIKQNSQETRAIAVRTCEESKVSAVERNGLQTILIASMTDPRQQLPQDDPVRREWGRKLGLDYIGVLEDAGHQRRQIQDGHHIDPGFWKHYMGNQVEPRCN